VCARYRVPGNLPSDVPRCVGRLLPKSEWGDGRPGESNTTATDSEPESEAGDESNSAEESTETKTTLVTVNHGFVVDSINVNGSRFGSSQGGNEAIIELEADEEILYVAAKRVRNVFKATPVLFFIKACFIVYYQLYSVLPGYNR